MAIPVAPPVFRPGYLSLLETGELYQRVTEATLHLDHCEMCSVHCGANRRAGALGRCRTGVLARVSSHGPHMGEESVLRGTKGSGTIFFAGCSLRCQFCRNFDISQAPTGVEVDAEEMAEMMLELQEYGCHNINLVTPDHVVPQILSAVLCGEKRADIPWCELRRYETSIRCACSTAIDIYLPDMKYSNTQLPGATLAQTTTRDQPRGGAGDAPLVGD